MIQTIANPLAPALPALERLKAARQHEPNPLRATPDEVVSYIRQLQGVDSDLGGVLEGAADVPQSERTALELKRAGVDAAISRQVALAARRMGRDRQGSLETLNAVFKLGATPDALNGRFRGTLVATTTSPWIDSFAGFMARLWLPWTGKRFDAQSSTGDNVFTPGARVAGRLIFPGFSDFRPYKPGLYTAFIFKTYTGPGVQDPEIDTLKLDYDNDSNPAFLVRTVLDELVKVSGNYYLGKAFLKRSGRYALAAFFALQRYE